MCGIAGFVGRSPSMDLLPAMLRLMKHRGPDDTGVHEEPEMGLGAARLAIIDLEGGRQPMTSQDGSLSIVFNGEIYNHRELRAALEAKGHRFRTRSDTEVILRLFADVGERCTEDLRGMFAFAVWDARRRRLFMARDRLGKKPLYYWHRGGLFLFASEIKALLCHPAVSRALDWEALHHYLAFGYTPGDRSIFADVAKLPPAHAAVLEHGALRRERYWRLPPGTFGANAPRAAPDPAALRHLLREAVRLRLGSDVPLGVFLSGGIDSSAIVAAIREVSGQRIATFSLGFGRAAPSLDELPYARAVARRFGTDHHEEILEPEVANLLPAIVHHFDEPFADSSAIPTFVIARAAAREVKVALSGIGGDEGFAGYPRYLGVRVSGPYSALPRWLRALPRAAVGALGDAAPGGRNWRGWARRFVAGAERPMPDRYLEWTRFFGDPDLDRLATPALRALWRNRPDERQRAAFAGHGHGDPVDGAFRIDLETYLPDDLLTMADRLGMAHSMEIRAPFCDHRLVEHSLALTPRVKIPRLRLKRLLKAAFADVLPPEVLARGKQGFMVPLGHWLRTTLHDTMEDLLSVERVRERALFAPAAVEALKREHLSGRRAHDDRLWTLMMAELWMRQHLDSGAIWKLA